MDESQADIPLSGLFGTNVRKITPPDLVEKAGSDESFGWGEIDRNKEVPVSSLVPGDEVTITFRQKPDQQVDPLRIEILEEPDPSGVLSATVSGGPDKLESVRLNRITTRPYKGSRIGPMGDDFLAPGGYLEIITIDDALAQEQWEELKKNGRTSLTYGDISVEGINSDATLPDSHNRYLGLILKDQNRLPNGRFFYGKINMTE